MTQNDNQKKAVDMVSLIVGIVVGVIVAGGWMAYDKYTDAGWEVSPQQIEEAKRAGKPGVPSANGGITVLPIKDELAGILPFKRILYGLTAGALTATLVRKIRKNRVCDCTCNFVKFLNLWQLNSQSVPGQRLKQYER